MAVTAGISASNSDQCCSRNTASQSTPRCVRAVFSLSHVCSAINRSAIMSATHRLIQEHADRIAEFEKVVDPTDKVQQDLLEEMKSQLAKLKEVHKREDPRLSFSTPEFKEAQRVFTDNLKNNFGRPVEWALVKKYPWSMPVLTKIEPAQMFAEALGGRRLNLSFRDDSDSNYLKM